ncbi:UMODL1 isoform 8, partial [Pongo abelii]
PVGSWYNVTILVKMDFKELQQVDPSLLNHMRLLHSLMSMSVSTRSSTPVLEGNCAQTWRAHTGASVTRKLQPRLHGS